MRTKLEISCFAHYETAYSAVSVRPEDAASLREALSRLGLSLTEWTRGWWIWRRTVFFMQGSFDDLPRIDRAIWVWRSRSDAASYP